MLLLSRYLLCFLVPFLFLAQVKGQVLRGESLPGAFLAAPSSAQRDLVPPTLELSVPIVHAARGFQPVGQIPRITTRTSTLEVRGLASDSGGVGMVYVGDKEAVLKKEKNAIGFTAIVPLLLGENRIDVVAVDRSENKRKLTLVVTREVGLVMGKYYALLIAVQNYQDPRLETLTNPFHDAESLKAVLVRDYDFVEKNVQILKNPETRKFYSVFEEYRSRLTRDDNLLIFFAGHGYWDPELRQGYWLPANARKDDRTDWISNSTIRDYIRGIKTQHTLLIADACFSGSIFNERGGIRPDVAIEKIYEYQSRRAITSGLSTVPDESVFLAYLVKRLRENTDRYLAAEALYIRMKEAVISNSLNNQMPRYGIVDGAEDEGGDFVFTRK